ncbi:hypothetical protein M0805_007086 [Coniferiporia weirii]|nr:hypothetical protein M0805_007086 [Coniferiporia weirii]
MLTDASSWTPPQGRHQVNVGKSMTRFLKQRKGIPQTKQNKAMPSSSYYHFKYKFMPESVDTTKPGIVELSNGTDATNVRVERASLQSNEVHVFRGKEEPAKEVECVLIYDEESGMFTLEKLDSSLALNHEGRSQPKARAPSASPLPTPSPAPSALKIDDDLTAELFRELESTLVDDDAEGEVEEPTPSAGPSRPQASSNRRPEPTRPPPIDNTNGKPKPKLRAPPLGTAPIKAKPAVPSPPVYAQLPPKPITNPPIPSVSSNPGTKSLGKNKAPGVRTIDVEEEVMEFGRPARPTKRARMSPPSTAPPMSGPTSLSLPGTSSANTFSLPSSDGLALPTSGGGVALAPPLPGPSAVPEDDDDDDEDEWDEVAGVGISNSVPRSTGASLEEVSTFGDGFADAEAEEINIDVDQFAAEMDMELLDGLEEEDPDGEGEIEGEVDGDDIFGDAADAAASDEPERPSGPMSLNQFAGGGVVGMDEADDDYSSSSDDSDDD